MKANIEFRKRKMHVSICYVRINALTRDGVNFKYFPEKKPVLLTITYQKESAGIVQLAVQISRL